MKVRKRRKKLPVPVMMTELMLASWETIVRWTLLIIQNDCSPGEYRRMVNEKSEAAARSASRFVSNAGRASLASPVSPWHARAWPMPHVCGKSSTGSPADAQLLIVRTVPQWRPPRFCHISAVCFYRRPGSRKRTNLFQMLGNKRTPSRAGPGSERTKN
jgi:hypothetical protein